MCVGRTPEDTLDVVLDALPTALSCEFVYLVLPGTPPKECASLFGAAVPESSMPEFRAAIAAQLQGTGAIVVPGAGRLWCLEAELPVGAERGRLLAGRTTPLDPETDRVLVRSAANLVGTTVESAHVLEIARRKDEFLAMLGHELRNPLAPILTAVELLARHPSAAREQHVIERHTRHLARLVDDLLDISRVTSGHIELRSEQVSLASVLERALEIAAPLVSRYRHALHVARADDVTLQGDPVRLAQIFGNLLTNAAKFTPPEGKIDVAIERAPGRVRIAVQDSGRGIAEAQLRRIFEPFVQADTERDALRGGLGLGLAIVNKLVERHGGTIAVQSAGPGRGSTFIVELPHDCRRRASVASAGAACFHRARRRARARGRRQRRHRGVAVRGTTHRRFRNRGRARRARSAPDLAPLRSARRRSGRWTAGARRLRARQKAQAEHGTDPTLIAATGYGQQKDRLLAADAGFDCHFVKPVSVHDLVHVLESTRGRLGVA